MLRPLFSCWMHWEERLRNSFGKSSENEIVFSAAKLIPGIYTVQLIFNQQVIFKKVVGRVKKVNSKEQIVMSI